MLQLTTERYGGRASIVADGILYFTDNTTQILYACNIGRILFTEFSPIYIHIITRDARIRCFD